MVGNSGISEENLVEAMLVIDGLRNLEPEWIILVEGNRDRESLRNLGVRGDIYVINDGKSGIETSEIIARKYRGAIILTDWDRTGGRLARSLREQLEALDVRCSMEERKKLAFLCKKEIKDVEALYSCISSGTRSGASSGISSR